jgi:DNA-3-methyladenine glycosylase I
VPVHDERKLFEFLTLEGAQAGLSWQTILNKRESYRKGFHQFDPARVARYAARDVERLMNDPGVVRNRLKILSAIENAKQVLVLRAEGGSFDRYLWAFVDGRPIPGERTATKAPPATSPVSDALSRDLKKRGFRFVGSTIIYAFMQAVGMVDDHIVECFRHRELARLARSSKKGG